METELLTHAAHEKVIIQSLVVILVTSSVIALVFQRLRLALIPAYLIAGVLVGPSGFALTASVGALEEIGHLAVVLLLFGVGMELHLSALQRNAKVLIGTSALSALFCFSGLFIPAYLLGLPLPQALVVAMGLSLSSTAVVLRLLANARELVRGHGQLSLAILVAQDLLVLVMLALIPVIAKMDSPAASAATDGNGVISLVVQSLITAAGLIVLFISGQKVLPRILAESLHRRSSELLILCAASVTLLRCVLN